MPYETTRKRPRNNAAPNGLDGALAIINREIEAASASKTRAADTEARLRSVEEELETLRAKYAVQGDIMRTKKSENARLKLENEAMKKRLKTHEEMAHRVLTMVRKNGTSAPSINCLLVLIANDLLIILQLAYSFSVLATN
jgi:regulator of replication initiation timing